jgi:superfamily II DNA or RNA helicase
MDVKTSMIGNGKVDLSGDIIFATVQTLFKKLYDIPQDTFGLVVCDECHHIAANADSVGMFRTCIDYFAARYKLGLTATLHRADGLEDCIPKLLGDVIYEIKEDGSDYVGIYGGKEVVRFPKTQFQVPAKVYMVDTNYKLTDDKGNYRDVFDKSGMTISFTKLISDIACDDDRNNKIINLAKSVTGSTIILSDRVDQLSYLQSKIPNSVEIDGKTKKDAREKALEDIKSGAKTTLLASYKLAKEGLDCKILENVIFATPVKDYAVVVQCIGRCQRPYEGKTLAKVFDLVDDVSTLKRFTTKRKNTYKRMNYECVNLK